MTCESCKENLEKLISVLYLEESSFESNNCYSLSIVYNVVYTLLILLYQGLKKKNLTEVLLHLQMITGGSLKLNHLPKMAQQNQKSDSRVLTLSAVPCHTARL